MSETVTAVDAYYGVAHVGFEQVPAAEAVRQLASLIADALGTGEADDEGETDGILDVPVFVTEGGVFGSEVAVTVQRPHAAVEVIVGDDALPIERLVALLNQLRRHCISPRIVR